MLRWKHVIPEVNSLFKQSHRDHSNFVNCVRYSPDGSKFITVSSDKKGIIYNGKSGEKSGELSSEGPHNSSIYAVSWSPDGKQVLIVSADKSAKVWDISENNNGKVKGTLTCHGSGGVEDMLVGCLWLNDHLVTVSLGGTISIFSASDLVTGLKCLQPFDITFVLFGQNTVFKGIMKDDSWDAIVVLLQDVFTKKLYWSEVPATKSRAL